MLSTDYPVRLLCEVVGLSHSSYYYCAVDRGETQLQLVIERIAAQYPTYGSRRITAQVKREASDLTPLGRKRVRRLMRELGGGSAPQKEDAADDQLTAFVSALSQFSHRAGRDASRSGVGL